LSLKKAILIGLVWQLAVSAFAASRLTIDQLDRLVASSTGKRDTKIAERLSGQELTERLSASRLAALEAALPGPESRRALVVLADQATFLNPPLAEIPNLPVPTFEQQRDITARAVDYVKSTLHRLPNLFANRDTIRFQDTPAILESGGPGAPSGHFVPAQPLHPVSRSAETVFYRNGQEIAEPSGEEQSAPSSVIDGLTTAGDFGPILSAVFSDFPQGNLAWSHWEQGPAKPVAVFHFQVPKGVSHYEVKFCCVSGRLLQQFSAYHGEITIDPADGTVLRLTIIANMGKADPVTKANLMVEYGPVELGKQTFYCPMKSISVTVAPVQSNIQRTLSGAVIPTTGGAVRIEVQDNKAADSVPQTLLNEVVFDQYHLFQSEARMLAADDAAPASATAPSSQANPNPQPVSTIESAIAATSPAAVPTSAAPPPATAPSPAPSAPEISVVAPTDLPQTPVVPAAPPAAPGFSLHVSTRLVDIGVTAYDKKGKPVTDLTRDDFVVYDNGQKQNPRSFSHASTAPASPLTDATTLLPFLYSNRLDTVGSAEPAGTSTPESSTFVLLDASSLSFTDFALARRRVLDFLDHLPASEPVGLYIRAGFGFRVLAEATTNHAPLSSALRAWMPNAQDLARAQEEDMRNRQQFDTVQSASDMQYVNGNIGGATKISSVLDIPGGGSGTSVDPKLMKEGSDPARQALTVVVAVAAHMGSIPGHKNLVWVASDNVLANWTDQAAGSDKGSGGIGSFAIRAQEALNDAHVSLYPLAASQLETSATDASLQNDSVKLDPSVADMNPKGSLGDATPLPGSRARAAMRQDLHPVQAGIQQMAQATGGRSFDRSDNIIANLNSVIEDGRNTYLLSFAPDTQPDDQYHRLTVAVPTRRGITLRYRAGYIYAKEPSTLKDRFKQAIWQPLDATEIAISARRASASAGAAVSLHIAANDVTLAQQGDRWTGRLNLFLVQRDETGMRAVLKEQTLALDLKPATYQKVLLEGIPFDEFLDNKQDSGTVRIIVVDENSGRIGSVTLPAAKETANP